MLVLWSSARGKKGFEARTHVLLDPGASEIRGCGCVREDVIRAVCEGSMRDLLGAELSVWRQLSRQEEIMDVAGKYFWGESVNTWPAGIVYLFEVGEKQGFSGRQKPTP